MAVKTIEPGSVYGSLTVIGPGEPIRYQNRLVSTSQCRCACGHTLLVRNDRLRQGRQTSCRQGPCRKPRASRNRAIETEVGTKAPQPLVADAAPTKASAWSTEMYGMPAHVKPRVGVPSAQERKARREYYKRWQDRLSAARSAI